VIEHLPSNCVALNTAQNKTNKKTNNNKESLNEIWGVAQVVECLPSKPKDLSTQYRETEKQTKSN
jgi:hypothetical protein